MSCPAIRILAVAALAAALGCQPAEQPARTGTASPAPPPSFVGGAKCASCHGAAGAGSFGGPALKGVAGRKIAVLAGYAFSAGLKAKAGTWSDANLAAYLAAPAKFAPGTKMFASVPDAAERSAVIGFLKTLK